MNNIYEEEYPTIVSYDKYERDIEEYKVQVENLQNEIYQKDRIMEALENFIEDLKTDYEILQSEFQERI